MGRFDSPTTKTQNPPQYLHWRGVAEDFDMDQFPEKRNRLQTVISQHISALEIPTRDINGVQKDKKHNFISFSIPPNVYLFDIYSEQFCGNNLPGAIEFREKNPNPEVATIISGVPILEEVMKNNSGYLNENDIIDFNTPKEFLGMTARELQMTLRGNIHKFEKNGGLLGIDLPQREKIAGLYRLYLEIIMGVGNTFEDGSAFFHKTEPEVDLYLRSTVFSFSSIEECFDYYNHIQSEIYNNSRSSKKNKEAYSIFSEKLGRLIFERLQREFDQNKGRPEEKDIIKNCVQFIKLITERTELQINNDLRNPLLAEEICIFIISRKGGVIDSIQNCSTYSLDFTDPMVGNRSPNIIIQNTQQKLEDCGIPNTSSFLRNNMGINTRIIVGNGNPHYNELPLKQKRQISILARLIEKIDSGELNPTTLAKMSESEVSKYIIGLSNTITQEAFNAVSKAYDKNFELRALSYTPPDFISILQEIGVSSEEIEAFTLFDDIRGNSGFFNFSDENINLSGSLSKSAGIIIGTIAVVMIATAITGGMVLPAIAPSLIASGGGLTLGGSLLSIGTGATLGTASNMAFFDPRGHDSQGEMLSDIGSDFIINTFHAMYMEKLTMGLWHGASSLGKSGLVGLDFGSGIGIEVVRENMLNSIYQSEPLLGDIHSINIEDLFSGLGYSSLQDEITPELKQRVLLSTNIFYLWNGYDVSIELEEEFLNINWSKEEILTALSNWLERQENRIS